MGGLDRFVKLGNIGLGGNHYGLCMCERGLFELVVFYKYPRFRQQNVSKKKNKKIKEHVRGNSMLGLTIKS